MKQIAFWREKKTESIYVKLDMSLNGTWRNVYTDKFHNLFLKTAKALSLTY